MVWQFGAKKSNNLHTVNMNLDASVYSDNEQEDALAHGEMNIL